MGAYVAVCGIGQEAQAFLHNIGPIVSSCLMLMQPNKSQPKPNVELVELYSRLITAHHARTLVALTVDEVVNLDEIYMLIGDLRLIEKALPEYRQIAQVRRFQELLSDAITGTPLFPKRVGGAC